MMTLCKLHLLHARLPCCSKGIPVCRLEAVKVLCHNPVDRLRAVMLSRQDAGGEAQ